MTTRQRLSDLGVALVVAGQFLVRTPLAARGSWVADDWGFLREAAIQTVGPDNWFYVYGGHLHPALWGLFRLHRSLLPGSYPTAALMSGVLDALAVVLVYLVLRRLFGARPGVVAVVAWFAFTPLTLDSRLWTTVAFYTLPFQIAFAGTILLFLRYLEMPTRWRAGLVIVGQTGAFLCWQEALFIPVVLFFLAAWMPIEAPQPLGWRAASHRHRGLWVALTALSTAYLAGYLWLSAVNSSDFGRGGVPDAGDVLRLSSSTISNFVVALIGGPLRWERPVLAIPDPPTALSVAALVVALTLVARTWRTRRNVAAIWMLVGVLLAADITIIAFGRLNYLAGPEDATYLRYLADLAVPTALALAYTFLDPRAIESPTAVASDSRRNTRTRLLAAVAMTFVLLAAGTSTLRLLQIWGESPTRRYLDNLTSALDQDVRQPFLIAQLAPTNVIVPPFNAEFPTPAIIAILDREAYFVPYVDSADDLFAILPDGSIGAAEVGGTPSTEVYRADGPGTCPQPLEDEWTRLDLNSAASGTSIPEGRWYAHLPVDSQHPTSLTIQVGQTVLEAELRAGRSDLYFDVIGPAEAIRLRIDDAEDRACLRNVTVGQLVQRP